MSISIERRGYILENTETGEKFSYDKLKKDLTFSECYYTENKIAELSEIGRKDYIKLIRRIDSLKLLLFYFSGFRENQKQLTKVLNYLQKLEIKAQEGKIEEGKYLQKCKELKIQFDLYTKFASHNTLGMEANFALFIESL